MKRKCLSLLLATMLLLMSACTSLTAEGISQPEGDGEGSDLRTRRGYSYGLIKEDPSQKNNGADDIYVMYFLFDNDELAFYGNDANMPFLTSLDLSILKDPRYTYENLYFEDKNQDGYNDLCLPLSEKEDLFFFWDPDGWNFGHSSAPSEGLWVTIANWPKDAALLDFQENDNGATHAVWAFEDGARLLIERSPSSAADAKAMRAVIAKAEGVKSSAITMRKSSSLTKSLTYPAYYLSYKSKSATTDFLNKDVIFQTDDWDFRIHVAMPLEKGKAVREKEADQWLKSLIFQTPLSATE